MCPSLLDALCLIPSILVRHALQLGNAATADCEMRHPRAPHRRCCPPAIMFLEYMLTAACSIELTHQPSPPIKFPVEQKLATMPTLAIAGGTSASLGRAITTALLQNASQWNAVILSRTTHAPIWLRAIDPDSARTQIRAVDYMSAESL